MSLNPIHKARTLLAAALLAAAGASAVAATAPPPALNGKLILRPLTPQDIKDHSLTSYQVASGLSTVGLGQPAHVEAVVNIAVPATDIQSVAWELSTKPLGSAAVLAESPLAATVPLFAPADRLATRLAGRAYLVPDLAGQYTVRATITTATFGATNVTTTITAGRYMGVNTCALCHSGGVIAPNMVSGWAETGHATKFERGIDGHEGAAYGQRCISCHTVGFDTNANAQNGGFDDVQTLLGWTFPTVVTNGNWEAVPRELKNLANIQCENCHGPGSEHAYSLGDKARISVSMSAGNCGQCHDSKNQHYRNAEWYNSKHAIATSYPTGPTRGSCVGCHSGVGFVDRMDGLTAHRTDYEAITCATCHDPHSATSPHQLRNAGPVTLSDGVTTIDRGGNGLLCMNCHKARVNATTYAETTAGSANFGPHYGSASDMLAGANGYTYGKIIPSSAHREVVTESCVQCHMQPVASTSAYFTKVGNHTFNPSWDGGTPDNPADDVKLTTACAQCHGTTTTFDFPRQDFDGDGAIEGVQTEVHGLLDELGNLLPPEGPDVVTSASYTRAQLKAAFNWKFVKNDGSYGVHNLSYAVGLLKESIADLTDDIDRDGLSDRWEIANWGTVTHCDATSDPDGDGVINSLEIAAGTNPRLADTDGDGASDLAEFHAGSDPMNAGDIPGLVVKLHSAGELEFVSETGKTYQIQMITELNTTWQPVSTNIVGTGQTINQLVSTRSGGTKGFFRVVEVQ